MNGWTDEREKVERKKDQKRKRGERERKREMRRGEEKGGREREKGMFLFEVYNTTDTGKGRVWDNKPSYSNLITKKDPEKQKNNTLNT